MKRYIGIILLIFISISFFGCQSNFDPERESMESTGAFMDVGITHGVAYPDPEHRTLKYDGKMVELEYYMSNREGRQRWGIQIFINGIQQPFYVDNSSAATLQYCSIFEDHQEKVYRIKFLPLFGSKGDTLTLHFVVMLNPAYIISSPQENSSYMAYHTITQLAAWKLVMNSNISKSPPSSQELYPTSSVQQEVTKNMDTSEVALNLYSNSTLVNLIQVNPNAPLELSIGIYGYSKEQPQITKYRISVYINHQIVNCFGGSYYADIDISDAHNRLLLYDLKINTSLLEKPYNHIYIIAVPVVKEYTENLPVVIKSRSIPLI